MSLISLKNKLFCNKKVTESNFSFKETLNNLRIAAVARLGALWGKVPSLNDITNKITSIATGIKDQAVQQATDFAENLTDSVQREIDSATDLYDAVAGKLTDIKTQAGLLLSCPDAIENDPENPTTNPTADTLATPSSNNDETNSISDDIKTKKELEKAKSQNLAKTSTVIVDANKKLADKGIGEIRETVKVLSKPHPILNKTIEQLSYFQPISQSVGENFFGYTVDKPSLQLADWALDAKVIRVSSKNKVRSDVITEIDGAYTGLNQAFATNISNEFKEERRSIMFNQAHGYHIAGDSLFVADHILNQDSALMGGLLEILDNVIGDQIALIDYLNPIKPKYTIESDYYTVESEKKPIVIDKRNNIVRKPFTLVDNSALSPKDLPEA